MIPLPLRDTNPTTKTPVVMIALVVANVLVWFYQLHHGVMEATLDYGVIPRWLLAGMRDGQLVLPMGDALRGHVREVEVMLHQEVPHPLTLLTSMFMHGGWMHLVGNMWFLWIFGDNVEDAMGRVRFVVFYLLCGVLAALAQTAVTPHSEVPMVGASGAIAGVLGGYLLLYPRARIRCLWVLIIFITTIELPAWALLGMWFVAQFFIPQGEGIAWAAHVGGFVAGLALIRLFAKASLPPGPRGPLRIINPGPDPVARFEHRDYGDLRLTSN